MRKWTAVLLSLFLLTGCSLSSDQNTSDVSLAEDSVMACDAGDSCEDSETIEDSFTQISFDDAVAFFKEGKSGVLYFGFPGCPWCHETVPILKEEAEKTGTEIFYVRTRDDNKERLYSDEQKEEIIPYIGNYMSDNDEGVLTLYVPLIVRVENGKAVDGHQGTVEGHNAHERDMTDEEKQELETIIDSLLNSDVQTS